MDFIQNDIQQCFSPDAVSQNPQAQNSQTYKNPAPDFASDAIKKQMSEELGRDIQAIDSLLQKGLIDSQQGLNVLCKRVNEVQQKYLQGSVEQKYDPAQNEFLKKPEYKYVLDYLSNTNADFNEGEISQITDIIKNIEQQAIAKYLRSEDYQKQLTAENTLAKQKLSYNAKKEGTDFSAPIFTREMIGKMSSADFIKNEKAIMDQLKKGLIR
ncbi:hypothetical protein J6E39_01630 [bacterium]|nr:hypothetical protein [bacterium]